MSKLDRSRPYGTVHGDSAAIYEQDGILFDGAGNPITKDSVSATPGSVAGAADAILSVKPEGRKRRGSKAPV